MRLAEALAAARTAGIARLDAQLLLGHLLGRPRAWLIAHDDTELDPAQTEALRQAFERRAAGVPLAYLTGEREFHGLVFRVGPAVLVPRPETEILVDWALELLAGGPAEVADLGTGSGAIAIALLHRNRCAHVCASDASPAALAQAGANARRLGVDVEFVAGDWWQPLAGRYFDLVVSNPPYVAGNDPHLEALAHEPRAALTPEGDGLDALRRIAAGSPAHLRPGGWLLLEHGHDQNHAVRALLAQQGFEEIETRGDLAGLPRCTGGRRPAPP